jgi:hypothetical protein
MTFLSLETQAGELSSCSAGETDRLGRHSRSRGVVRGRRGHVAEIAIGTGLVVDDGVRANAGSFPPPAGTRSGLLRRGIHGLVLISPTRLGVRG